MYLLQLGYFTVQLQSRIKSATVIDHSTVAVKEHVTASVGDHRTAAVGDHVTGTIRDRATATVGGPRATDTIRDHVTASAGAGPQNCYSQRSRNANSRGPFYCYSWGPLYAVQPQGGTRMPLPESLTSHFGGGERFEDETAPEVHPRLITFCNKAIK
jgi:hypothetical protein